MSVGQWIGVGVMVAGFAAWIGFELYGGYIDARYADFVEAANREDREVVDRPYRLFRELASDGEKWWFKGEGKGG